MVLLCVYHELSLECSATGEAQTTAEGCQSCSRGSQSKPEPRWEVTPGPAQQGRWAEGSVYGFPFHILPASVELPLLWKCLFFTLSAQTQKHFLKNHHGVLGSYVIVCY